MSCTLMGLRIKAREFVALLVFQPLGGPHVGTRTLTHGLLFHKLHALLCASIANLGTWRPLTPATEFALFLTSMGIASSCLRCGITWLPFESHCSLDIAQALLNTTATLCTALTPALPLLKLTIYWARLRITCLHCGKW